MPNCEELWNQRFQQMLDYRKKHGSLIFKPKCGGADAELRAWIYSQRRLLRTKKMPRRRVAILKSVNFEWKRGVIHQDRWDDMYNQLVAYYETHGHLVVTARTNSLGTWICTQRAHRRTGKLSQDRIDRLNKLPFSWSGMDGELEELQQHGWDNAPPNFYFKEWNAKFKDLMEFKERFGHMEVSRGYNETLSVWILRQRKLYASGSLREERVTRLNSVGFSWDLYPRKTKKVKSTVSQVGKATPEKNRFPLGKGDPLPLSPSTLSTTRKRKAADSEDEYEDSEYEDEALTRKGGKPVSERARRKARRDNIIYEEAKNASSLLAGRSTRNRPKTSSPELVACKASITKPASTPLIHVWTSAPTQLFDETEHGLELLGARPARDRPTRKGNMRRAVTTENREAPPNTMMIHPPPTNDVYPIGTQILNFFPGHGWYKGTVQAVDKQKYTVVYDDGDVEEFLIEGPTMDALVELAKSNPDLCLGDSAPVTPKACETSAPMCASNQGYSGGLQRSQDMTIKKSGMKSSGDVRNMTTGKVASQALERDEMVKPTETEGLASSKIGSEYEILLKRANKAAAQTELEKMGSLLRHRERKCHENEKLIEKLKARIVDLKQSQFVTGSVAHKVLSRLQCKL